MSVSKKLTKKDYKFLIELEELLYERKVEMPKGSYTTSMYKKGLDKIAQKVGEEAVETVIASKNEGDSETIAEAADLLFHLMLLLAEKEIPMHKVVKLLRKRHSRGNHKHIGE
ncbi:MAG TPA: phosphoribosyl-ATP diphosphatase [Balneola sp.]|jgi:phosphoribosyl-ATP pyrophosphohydrolase/phosphoribosyl-AMP cyclohydrolase|nr:phosphoribosyl-ATP diphosphatase [Bacteroidota bacterium]MAC06174.1 phosphoribosyl-ATP diphosphatase [Balneola sp.]MAO78530.1 phosphoribosyl-ATP diphosphatase [Balneola sp.]MBF64895.1 phosphoribosyl-ATP diphosphatase [Balneola sp.]HAH50700.1 phosphoribosyl-ATP diphosphatase [Balneola sp.]|tara:strand:+ start:16904 stop:17242 length:339 start_codon:yes stop_codon:yes gene_type:complete